MSTIVTYHRNFPQSTVFFEFRRQYFTRKSYSFYRCFVGTDCKSARSWLFNYSIAKTRIEQNFIPPHKQSKNFFPLLKPNLSPTRPAPDCSGKPAGPKAYKTVREKSDQRKLLFLPDLGFGDEDLQRKAGLGPNKNQPFLKIFPNLNL